MRREYCCNESPYLPMMEGWLGEKSELNNKRSDVVVSPIRYMGCKRKLIHRGLIDKFPKVEGRFVDVFCGSGTVAMNVIAKEYLLNDKNEVLIGLLRLFKENTALELITKVEEKIKKYGLPMKGSQKEDAERENIKMRYYKLRSDYNETRDAILLYVLGLFSFSQGMRFNYKGEYNMPMGNRGFYNSNREEMEKSCDFITRKEVVLSNNDFEDIEFKDGDFVYLDPPYIGTEASYNKEWKEDDQRRLYRLCEKLTERGIKWAMSNVMINKGRENTSLKEWIERNRDRIKLDTFKGFSYEGVCGQKQEGRDTEEVLLKNYEE